MDESYEPAYETVSMKVQFSKAKAESNGYQFPNFPDLTDGKIYEVEGLTEVSNADDVPIPAYMLVEDDADPQAPYSVGIFEVVYD